jgi:hypothetical protein
MKMTKFFDAWKQLIKKVGWQAIIDAFLASLFYTILILIPMVLIYAQLISLFFLRINLWVILIMISVIGLGMIQSFLWKKTLILNHQVNEINFNFMIKIHLVVWSILVLIIGLLFIFIFIPFLQI